MKSLRILIILVLSVSVIGCTSSPKTHVGPAPGEKWQAIHLLGYDTDPEIVGLIPVIPQLAEMGVNVIVFEVDYNFAFDSHPELRWGEDPQRHHHLSLAL